MAAAGASRTWFLIPAGVVLLVVLGVWMARSAAPVSRDHTGREDVRVVLDAPEGGGEAAAKALIERLVLLGLDGRIVRAEDRQVELTIRRVAEAEQLLSSVLDPEPLTFHLIPEPQGGPAGEAAADAGSAAPAPEATPTAAAATGTTPAAADAAADATAGAGKIDPENPTPWVLGAGRAATREKRDPSALAEDETFLMECIPPRPKGTPPPCALWRAKQASRLTARDVVDVKIGAHRRTEEPLVTLTFREDARPEVRKLAENAVGRMIAVVAFGEVAARPRIHDEAEAPDPEKGTWRFTTRTGDTDRRTAQERALRISTAANLPRLPPLTIRSVEAAPAPLPPTR